VYWVKNFIFLNSHYKFNRTSDHTLVRNLHIFLFFIENNSEIVMNLFSRIQLLKIKIKIKNIKYMNTYF
jgi:hypothetical protein